MPSAFLSQLALVLGVAFAIIALFERLRLPPALGLLIAGVVLGPSTLGALSDPEGIRLLGELGVILLLFAIGLEFSPKELWLLRYPALLGGSLQILSTIGLAALIWHGVADASVPAALSAGFIVCLSSTALGLQLLSKQGELSTVHGRAALGVLLFQDLAIGPLILAMETLRSNTHSSNAAAFLVHFGAVLTGAVLLFLLVRWGVPLLLRGLRLPISRELVVLLALSLGIGSAVLSEHLNIPTGLGALLAGLALSGIRERYHLTFAIEPFRDAFAAVFFLAVGLSLSASLWQMWASVVLLAVAIVLGKALLVTVLFVLLRYPLRTALLTAVLLSNIGEFSFVLVSIGSRTELLSAATTQQLLEALVLSMVLTPVLYSIAERFAPSASPTAAELPASDVLVIGYGVSGQNVCEVLRSVGISFAVMELNPRTVAELRARGERVIQGDCTDERALRRAGADQARVIVLAISDTLRLPQAVAVARTVAPEAFIIVRTRFVAQIEPLYDAGASAVVAEEFEASLHIIAILMRQLGMPEESIAEVQERFRSEHYQRFHHGAVQE
jgi:CPA2 family monovalent cation:H+ antiporter-2